MEVANKGSLQLQLKETAQFVSFKMDDAAKKIEPSEKAVAGLTEKVPVIYFLSGQGKGGQHIYILIVECV